MSILASFGNRRVRCANTKAPLTALFIAISLCFATFVHAQNTIKTVAGAGPLNSSPLAADVPGPTGVVEDINGNLYVAPPNSQYVFEMLHSTGQSIIFAGEGWIGDYFKVAQATDETMWAPWALATDAQGNIYIADSENNAIRKVDTSGNMSTIAGIFKPCPGGKCGDGGPATSARLYDPEGVALDKSGNIYIADTGDNRVRCVVMVSGGCGSTLAVGTIVGYAGTIGVACSSSTSACGDGGKANLAYLNTPIGIAVDKSGYLYIADQGDNRIRMVGNKRIISTIAGTGTLCYPATSACGDGGAATSADLGFPRAVAIDSSENLYIADTRDQRIRIVSAGTINNFAGQPGVSGFSGDGQNATLATLNGPYGVYADSSGNIFISDTGNQRVREVSGGVIQTVFGGGNGEDGGASTQAMLANSYQVAVDSSGNYYIADTSNNRIRVVNTQSGSITVATVTIAAGDIATIAGTGNAGYTGDGAAALNATLDGPFGVALDGSGNIYVADTTNRVIREINAATGFIQTFAGTGSPCSPSTGSCGDGGSPLNAQFTDPTTVITDGSGNVFIADASAERIREVSGGVISTVAGTGVNGYSGDGAAATSAELSRPFGIAIDANENLYIADSGNNVIRCVLGATGGCGDSADKYAVGDIITYAYNGNINFAGDGGPAINAQRWLPSEVALDSRGNLFVGGGNDYLVQRIDLATGIIVTVAGNDTTSYYYGYAGDGGPATKAHIDSIGLVVDSKENLLIADNGNNRIREVALVPVATLSATSLTFPDQAVGTTSSPMQVTLQNTGSDDLTFSTITVSGDFAQTNTCQTVGQPPLAPSQSCTINVTFTPKTTGTLTGKVTITDNGYHTTQTIKLTGTGD
jgi:trimeric autotransporter adhesin